MKSLLTAIAAAGMFLASAMSAQAMTTYDLRGPYAESNSFSIGDLTVTGSHQHGSTVHDTEKVVRTWSGMGVKNWTYDDPRIDGAGTNDVLELYFSSAVKMISARFSSIGGEEFAFYFDDDGNGSLSYDFVGEVNPIGSSYTFLGTYIGQTFGFGARGSHDDYYLKSVTVSAVPLPAALPLYGAGLAVIGFVGWRKRRKAAAQA